MTTQESAVLTYIRGLRLARERNWARTCWRVLRGLEPDDLPDPAMSERRWEAIAAEVERLFDAEQAVLS
jgi:hypothetical protein